VRAEQPIGHLGAKAVTARRVAPGRPVTAVLVLVRVGLLLVVPLSILVGGTSTGGRLATVAAVAALAVAAAVPVVLGFLRLGWPHFWITMLACVLIISFVFPVVPMPTTMPVEKHRVVHFVGALGGLTPTELTRLTDLVGMLAGLALLAIGVMVPPRAGHLARVIALTGAVAAVYVLAHGTYDNGRLQGLSCNPNYLGILLTLPMVASVGLIRYRRDVKWLAPAAVCFVAMADTQSRGAFIGAAAGIAVVLIQGRPVRWQALMSLAVAASAVTVLGAHGIHGLWISDRGASDMSTGNGLRLHAAELAVRATVEHPLRGVGYWMFPTYARHSRDLGVYIMTHDDYLRLAAEAGLGALVAFLVLLGLGAVRRRSGDPAVLRAVVVAYAAGLLFANPAAILEISTPFWVALGCLLAPVADAEGATTARPIEAVHRMESPDAA
jgi:hypothetical protein